VHKLAAGYRSSKVVGLLVSPDGKQPYAVLSIGGFRGMGTRLVVVPYDTPEIRRQYGNIAGRYQGGAQDAARVQTRYGGNPRGAAEVAVRAPQKDLERRKMMNDTSSEKVRILESGVTEERQSSSGCRAPRLPPPLVRFQK